MVVIIDDTSVSSTTSTSTTTTERMPTSPMLSGSPSSSTPNKSIPCSDSNPVETKTKTKTSTTTTKLSTTPPTTTMPGSPMSPSSPLTNENQIMVLENMTVRIQKRPTTTNSNNNNKIDVENTIPSYETVHLKELRLPVDATLEDIRTALTQCELGDARRDIFFPAWTKSLYVTVNGNEETIETDEQLREILTKERDSSGSVILQLQECRNARYSRRKRNNRRRNETMAAAAAAALSAPMFMPPPMYMMGEPTARADQPIYFDRPMAYYPYNFGGAGGELAFLPPPFIVPIQMYSNTAAITGTTTNQE